LPSKPLLVVEGLSASIGRKPVLQNIHLALNYGECVALVGGSGAGKSCLLRNIMGLHKPARPTQGVIEFDGQRFKLAGASHNSQLRSGMAYVPQNPQAGLDPLMRLENQWQQAIRYSRGRGGESQQALLAELGLKGLAASFPHQWSQGMQQRLLIAFALLRKPKLLVLDEPTSALDPLVAARAITTIMHYAKQHNIAVLMVSHDLALASRFAERIAILNRGTLEAFCRADQLHSAPPSDYAKLLVDNHSWTNHGRFSRH